MLTPLRCCLGTHWRDYSGSMLLFSLTYTPSRNLRISFLLTMHTWWMREALLPTFSIELPSRAISSLLPVLSTFTPSFIGTLRMTFSPRKLRISSDFPPSVGFTLMGKCSGGGGLSHVAPTAELGALVLEGDDGDHGVLNNDGFGVVHATAVVTLCVDVLAVAVLVGGGVGEDVRTSQLNVHTAVWDTVGKGAIKGVGAGSLLLGVREGSLNGDGFGAARDDAGRADVVLDDNSAGSGESLLASRVLAVVVDQVGANSSHVHNVAGNLNILGDVAVNHVGAGGASVNVVVVAGSLDVPDTVVRVGNLEDSDDRAGLVEVDEGTASGSFALGSTFVRAVFA